MATSDAEIAWLAGLLEGEGSFMTVNNRVSGKVYRYPKIVVGMTDRDIVERVARMFDVTVYNMPLRRDRKPAFRAQTSGANAAKWMQALYPWLGSRRRARIDEVLAEYEQLAPTAERRRASCSDAAKHRTRNVETGRFQ